MFRPLSAAVAAWAAQSALDPCRHATVLRKIEEEAPGVATLVEYDPVWRGLPLPAGLLSAHEQVGSHGQASVLYDAERFELLHPELALSEMGLQIPGYIRSANLRAVEAAAPEVEHWSLRYGFSGGGANVMPKSSCVALLRQRSDRKLLLVMAVHLASAPPSDSATVYKDLCCKSLKQITAVDP